MDTLLIFIKLLLAHLLTDFVFQSRSSIKQKYNKGLKSGYLWIHVTIAGILTYLFLAQWANWYIPLFIAVTHLLIDWIKIKTGKDHLKIFLLDQFAHILMLVIAWIWITGQGSNILNFFNSLFSDRNAILIITAYVLITHPFGYIISKATARWREEIESSESDRDSLNEAGHYIGIFERILVITFVLLWRFEAIGFLIAAKSILRFGDRNETHPRKKTEYVLLGTLMSFTLSIFLGLLIRYLVSIDPLQ